MYSNRQNSDLATNIIWHSKPSFVCVFQQTEFWPGYNYNLTFKAFLCVCIPTERILTCLQLWSDSQSLPLCVYSNRQNSDLATTIIWHSTPSFVCVFQQTEFWPAYNRRPKLQWLHAGRRRGTGSSSRYQHHLWMYFVIVDVLGDCGVVGDCGCTWWSWMCLVIVGVLGDRECTWWLWVYLVIVDPLGGCGCTWWLRMYLVIVDDNNHVLAKYWASSIWYAISCTVIEYSLQSIAFLNR